MTNKVTAQEHFDSVLPSPDYINKIKIEGATEMVMMFIKNNPRAIGKAFLIDQLNSYKARLNEVNHEQ